MITIKEEMYHIGIVEILGVQIGVETVDTLKWLCILLIK
jgi:hypothetical protein